MHTTPKVGIDDLAVYLPSLYLPIQTLAEARDLEYAKLNKGLGLEAMSVADAHEDVATMAANAVLQLLQRNELKPQQIGRIYMGTESAVDGSKPMASYVLDMLTNYYAEEEGPDAFLNCDVVDLTFACIGAVDALQNTLDWVRGGEGRIGIVVASDVARYEMASGGEYTQGAGAVAMLVKQNPSLLSIHDSWGVASRSVHDFFKPLRQYSKQQIVAEVLRNSGQDEAQIQNILQQINESEAADGLLSHQDAFVEVHRDTPVFDGPYSNNCYQERIGEALQHYAMQEGVEPQQPSTDDWHRMIFHLPYAYQARRMYAELYMEESKKRGDWERTAALIEQPEPQREQYETAADYEKAKAQYLRAITKTERYRRFVAEKIEKGERASSKVGNLYTASIFLALMSTLEADLESERDLTDATFGFFAYGSGSKSKVFTATVESGWRARTTQFQFMAGLEQRHELDYPTYERLHRGLQTESVQPPTGAFYLKHIQREKGVQEGAREYGWRAVEAVAALAG
jgi:hydroxymethylglutaryl-CoA synthase